MDRQKVYQRAEYKPQKKKGHLVLTGFINTQELRNFFEELYHQDHGDNRISSVILEQQNMSPEMSSLLSSFKHANLLKYLQGGLTRQPLPREGPLAHVAGKCEGLRDHDRKVPGGPQFRGLHQHLHISVDHQIHAAHPQGQTGAGDHPADQARKQDALQRDRPALEGDLAQCDRG